MASKFVLRDGNGEQIPGECYDSVEDALEAREALMAEHPDGDDVTVHKVKVS